VRRPLIALLLLAGLASSAHRPSRQELVPAPDPGVVLRFMVQHQCLDRAGVPQPGVTPIDPACGTTEPAQAGPLAYRRLDWSGVQASDAVLLPAGAIAHTFDFGDPPRAFGRLDRGLGDGGDLVVVSSRGVGIQQTEDGGAGRQWWRDPDCHAGDGWLLFRGTPTIAWVAEDGRLARASDPVACPTRFSAVHTRWRLGAMTLPWVDTEGRAGATHREVIVSEHFAGGPPDRADHLERFVFAEQLGKVAWERWEHGARTRRSRDELQLYMRVMQGDQRCPVAGEPPGPGWLLIDCRVWMRFQRATARSLHWP